MEDLERVWPDSLLVRVYPDTDANLDFWTRAAELEPGELERRTLYVLGQLDRTGESLRLVQAFFRDGLSYQQLADEEFDGNLQKAYQVIGGVLGKLRRNQKVRPYLMDGPSESGEDILYHPRPGRGRNRADQWPYCLLARIYNCTEAEAAERFKDQRRDVLGQRLTELIRDMFREDVCGFVLAYFRDGAITSEIAERFHITSASLGPRLNRAVQILHDSPALERTLMRRDEAEERSVYDVNGWPCNLLSDCLELGESALRELMANVPEQDVARTVEYMLERVLSAKHRRVMLAHYRDRLSRQEMLDQMGETAPSLLVFARRTVRNSEAGLHILEVGWRAAKQEARVEAENSGRVHRRGLWPLNFLADTYKLSLEELENWVGDCSRSTLCETVEFLLDNITSPGRAASVLAYYRDGNTFAVIANHNATSRAAVQARTESGKADFKRGHLERHLAEGYEAAQRILVERLGMELAPGDFQELIRPLKDLVSSRTTQKVLTFCGVVSILDALALLAGGWEFVDERLQRFALVQLYTVLSETGYVGRCAAWGLPIPSLTDGPTAQSRRAIWDARHGIGAFMGSDRAGSLDEAVEFQTACAEPLSNTNLHTHTILVLKSMGLLTVGDMVALMRGERVPELAYKKMNRNFMSEMYRNLVDAGLARQCQELGLYIPNLQEGPTVEARAAIFRAASDGGEMHDMQVNALRRSLTAPLALFSLSRRTFDTLNPAGVRTLADLADLLRGEPGAEVSDQALNEAGVRECFELLKRQGILWLYSRDGKPILPPAAAPTLFMRRQAYGMEQVSAPKPLPAPTSYGELRSRPVASYPFPDATAELLAASGIDSFGEVVDVLCGRRRLQCELRLVRAHLDELHRALESLDGERLCVQAGEAVKDTAKLMTALRRKKSVTARKVPYPIQQMFRSISVAWYQDTWQDVWLAGLPMLQERFLRYALRDKPGVTMRLPLVTFTPRFALGADSTLYLTGAAKCVFYDPKDGARLEPEEIACQMPAGVDLGPQVVNANVLRRMMSGMLIEYADRLVQEIPIQELPAEFDGQEWADTLFPLIVQMAQGRICRSGPSMPEGEDTVGFNLFESKFSRMSQVRIFYLGGDLWQLTGCAEGGTRALCSFRYDLHRKALSDEAFLAQPLDALCRSDTGWELGDAIQFLDCFRQMYHRTLTMPGQMRLSVQVRFTRELVPSALTIDGRTMEFDMLEPEGKTAGELLSALQEACNTRVRQNAFLQKLNQEEMFLVRCFQEDRDRPVDTEQLLRRYSGRVRLAAGYLVPWLEKLTLMLAPVLYGEAPVLRRVPGPDGDVRFQACAVFPFGIPNRVLTRDFWPEELEDMVPTSQGELLLDLASRALTDGDVRRVLDALERPGLQRGVAWFLSKKGGVEFLRHCAGPEGERAKAILARNAARSSGPPA